MCNIVLRLLHKAVPCRAQPRKCFPGFNVVVRYGIGLVCSRSAFARTGWCQDIVFGVSFTFDRGQKPEGIDLWRL